MLTKQETLLGRGARRRAGGWGSLGGLLCHVAHCLGFYGDGTSFRVVLAHHSDSGSFPVAHTLLNQDGCQQGGFWEVVEHVASSFGLSRTLPSGGGLLVPCSLSALPVKKWLIQTDTTVPGQGVSPNRPRDRTLVSHIAGRVFTIWATREAPSKAHGLPTISPTSSQACTWVFTWLFHCSELHWRGLQEWGSLQLAAGGWPPP